MRNAKPSIFTLRVLSGLLTSLALIFTLTISSCFPSDVEPEYIGELHFSDHSMSFFPYIGRDRIIFHNATGDSIILRSREVARRNELDYLNLQVGNESRRLTFSKTTREITLRGIHNEDSVIFHMKLDIRNQYNQQSDSLFFEILSMHSVTPAGLFMDIVTDDRGKPSFKSDHALLYENSQLLPDTILVGSSFNAVYYNERYANEVLFYQKEKGIIAFYLFGGMWVLKE